MRKYTLMKFEKDAVKEFESMSIPFEFRSGRYRTYMQYFEMISFDVCYCLKKGKHIDLKTYELLCQEPVSYLGILDEDSQKFINCYHKVIEIAQKYHPMYTKL